LLFSELNTPVSVTGAVVHATTNGNHFAKLQGGAVDKGRKNRYNIHASDKDYYKKHGKIAKKEHHGRLNPGNNEWIPGNDPALP
jgi:hypothetical protein